MNHKEIHNDNRKTYKCPYEGCDKLYTTKSGLDSHINRKHLKKFYKCIYCEKELSTVQKLKHHQSVFHFSPSQQSPTTLSELALTDGLINLVTPSIPNPSRHYNV